MQEAEWHAKKGLAPANKVGVIDSDYRGEIIVALHNHSDKPVTIEPKDRIAQIVLAPYITASFNEVEELDDTEKRRRRLRLNRHKVKNPSCNMPKA